MKKNLLKEQYARLFKGKPMSNDASLINEAVSDLKHRYDEDGDLVITGKMNGRDIRIIARGPSPSGWTMSIFNPDENRFSLMYGDEEKKVAPAILKYVKAKGIDWNKRTPSADDEDDVLDEPVSAFLKGDLGTIQGLPVNSITLHYFGAVVNLNANIDGLEDYYGDDSVIEYLQDTVDGMKGKPEYRNWIKEIEAMGRHSAKDIEKALDEVEYTESGMNTGGDISTEADL